MSKQKYDITTESQKKIPFLWWNVLPSKVVENGTYLELATSNILRTRFIIIRLFLLRILDTNKPLTMTILFAFQEDAVTGLRASSSATNFTMGCTSAIARTATFFIKMDTAAPVSWSWNLPPAYLSSRSSRVSPDFPVDESVYSIPWLRWILPREFSRKLLHVTCLDFPISKEI